MYTLSSYVNLRFLPFRDQHRADRSESRETAEEYDHARSASLCRRRPVGTCFLGIFACSFARMLLLDLLAPALNYLKMSSSKVLGGILLWLRCVRLRGALQDAISVSRGMW